MERKLAAILAADVVGYSSLMERDEAGTFHRLLAGRKELFEPEIEKRHGRIFKLMGDGLLAEFGSVVDAVECAASLQRGLSERNASLPEAEHIEVRIGVNLGEVIVDGDDRYGEGVNISARLQALADRGGICVSGKVAREVEKKLAFRFESMGEQKVKNIAEPVAAYRVVLDNSEFAVASTRPLALPDRPSVAVLPFQNMSGDVEQEYFADGVVDEIITALSRFRRFSVVARNSAFTYKGRALDVRQVAKELGVRYVLEGSIRRSGNRVRITTQLVDCTSGTHLWASTFDGTLDEVFDFQDRITESVATLVEPHIRGAEIEHARRERPGSIAAYDVYLSVLPKILAESQEANAEADALLASALSLDADNALLLSHAAWVLEHRITMGWPSLAANDRERCYEFARRGLENAAGDPTVMAQCAMALVQVVREYDWGMAVLTAALEANPNNMLVVATAGVANLHCGSVADALALFHRARRLSPRDPSAHLSLCGTAHAQMILGNYEEALAWATRAIAVNPNFDAAYWILIAANAHLGRPEEARRFLHELGRISPGVTIARITAGQPAKDPARLAAILGGLRIAGLPES